MEGFGCNALTLILSCGAFMIFGLEGLGYAYVADNALCLVIYYIVCRRWYGFSFPMETVRNILVCTGIGTVAFISTFLSSTLWSLALGISALVISATIAWIRLLRLKREEADC